MSDTDLQLLAHYARHHAEDAFAEIVRRHLNLVFSAALRQVRSPQLAEEAQRISVRAAQSSGVQDQKSTNDKVAMGVGIVIFWPALLMTKGNDENTAELARLKGQMDAIEETSIKKRCGIRFQKAPPPEEAPGQQPRS